MINVVENSLVLDTINKKSGDDFFNCSINEIKTGGINGIEIHRIIIPWTFPNIRTGVNDVFRLDFEDNGVPYSVSYTVPYEATYGFIDAPELLALVNGNIQGAIQTVVTANPGAPPLRFRIINSTGKNLLFDLVSVVSWGGAVNGASTSAPKIKKIYGNMPRMLGCEFNDQVNRLSHRSIYETPNSCAFYADTPPIISPQYLKLRSKSLSKYCNTFTDMGDVIAVIPLSFTEFGFIIDYETKVHMNYLSTGNGDIDFQLEDQFGPLYSYAPNSTIQLHVRIIN